MPSPHPVNTASLRPTGTGLIETPSVPSKLRNDQRDIDRQGRKLIVSHGIWSVVGKFTNLAVAFFNTSIVARLLSPTEFSDVNRLRTFMMLFSIGLASGLAQCGLRSLGRLSIAEKNRERIRGMLRQYLIRFVTCASIVTAVSLATLYWNRSRVVESDLSTGQIVLTILGILLIGLSELTSELHRGLGAPGRANFFGGTKGAPAATMIFIVLLLIASLTGNATFAVANAMFVFSTGIVSISGLISLSRLSGSLPLGMTEQNNSENTAPGPLPSAADPQSRYGIWPDAILLSLAFMISFSILQGDIFLCGSFSNPDETAAYIGARRCIQLISIPLMVVNTMASGIITPLIASGSHALLERTLRGFAGAAALPAIGLSAAFLLKPQLSLYLILGPGYSSGETALQILAIGQIIYVLSGSCGLVLSLHGCRRSVFVINIITLLALLIAGPVAAATYGPIGLAVVSASILAVNNIVSWYVARRLTGINTWCSFLWLLRLRQVLRAARSSGPSAD